MKFSSKDIKGGIRSLFGESFFQFFLISAKLILLKLYKNDNNYETLTYLKEISFPCFLLNFYNIESIYPLIHNKTVTYIP